MVVKHNSGPSAVGAEDTISESGADEPTKAEILEELRLGLKEALAGEGRPAREALAELRRKLAGNADPS